MDCAASFEKDVAALPGVTWAELNFGASRLTVVGEFNPEAVVREGKRHDIIIWPEGEKAEEKQTFWQQHKRIIISSFSGIALLAGWILKLTGAPETVGIILFLAAMVIGGAATARRAWFSLQKFRFDMNVLMTVAVIGAAAIGEWSEGAVVAFLYSVSNTLESYTMEKARQSIRELMKIAPREALVRRNGKEVLLPVNRIRMGDIMIVRPGEKIAMDGRVIKGNSAVDQAAITGESIPVEKGVGDEVFAGTLNQEGAIEVEVTKLVNDTTIARIIHMVEEAQARRAPFQAFVDRFAAVYTPVVLALAAGIVLVPPLAFGQSWGPWIYRGLALLVVSCPCALVVSTPVALVAAIGNAARNGVLIKGVIHLEEAGALLVVAFDKTGTLTVGKPVVTDVIPTGERDRDRLLALAASIEQLSEHPLARAIVAKARDVKLELFQVENFQAFAGKGARAEVAGRVFYIGSLRLFEEIGTPVNRIKPLLGRLQEQGKTAMILGTETDILGVIAVADQVRETSKNAVRELKKTGVRTAMLTGDNAATAAAIAEQVRIDEFEADLLPENKVDAVKKLIEKYDKVAMVGDGINDAPALAMATVGIAMGGAGTDIALETADIVIMADDLSRLPFCIRLSRAALRVIRQNVAFALIVKLSAVLLVFPGWLTLWLAILADMGASVLVTLNGIRLLRLKPQNRAEENW
jgi:Cd2+/Zn2+-exporting ATPase